MIADVFKCDAIRSCFIAIFASFVAFPAHAADNIDCVFDALSTQSQLHIGDVGLATMTGQTKNGPPPSVIAEANRALVVAMEGCVAKFGWSENDANNAAAYTTIRSMLIVTRSYVEKSGGDPNVADLFYAQNKYKILEEQAAGQSSEAWGNQALELSGYAPKGSKAFEVVWFYMGLLFQRDDILTAFIEGKTAEWSSPQVKQ